MSQSYKRYCAMRPPFSDARFAKLEEQAGWIPRCLRLPVFQPWSLALAARERMLSSSGPISCRWNAARQYWRQWRRIFAQHDFKGDLSKQAQPISYTVEVVLRIGYGLGLPPPWPLVVLRIGAPALLPGPRYTLTSTRFSGTLPMALQME